MEDQKEETLDNGSLEENVPLFRVTLLDVSASMAKRFRTIFTLRNIGGKDAIDALAAGCCIVIETTHLKNSVR